MKSPNLYFSSVFILLFYLGMAPQKVDEEKNISFSPNKAMMQQKGSEWHLILSDNQVNRPASNIKLGKIERISILTSAFDLDPSFDFIAANYK